MANVHTYTDKIEWLTKERKEYGEAGNLYMMIMIDEIIEHVEFSERIEIAKNMFKKEKQG